MNLFNSDLLSIIKWIWQPLLRMEKTNEYATKLGIHSYPGKFAFAQLTYLDLTINDITDIQDHINLERMNWDGTYAKDMATFLSILSTNRIPCKSWEELKRLFEEYEKNWKSRFLISLFCEAISKKGYYGHPLYYSELVGYRKRGKYYKGLLDIIREYDLNKAFDWMHKRIFLKLKNVDVRSEIEKDFWGKSRCRVYPYLVFGSPGWASYNKFEKLGGIDSVLSSNVPENTREEIYIMVICCFSSAFTWSESYYEKLFSDINNLRVKDVIHFGADTAIRISPLFAFLQSEIGHIHGHHIRKDLPDFLSETSDGMSRTAYTSFKGIESAEQELDYSNLWSGAPLDMEQCVKKDLKELHIKRSIKRSHYKYSLSKEWFKKLREE